MCCIALQLPGGKRIHPKTLRNMWEANPHGAGYMYAYENRLIVRKAFYKLADLVENYTDDRKLYGQCSPFVLHFRWCTHGSHKPHNIHPHLIYPDVGMAHNGIFADVQIPKKRDISDTIAFIEQRLRGFSHRYLFSNKWARLMGKRIKGNKIALLNAQGWWNVVNEQDGIWDTGVWYSNDSYKGRTKWVSCSATWDDDDRWSTKSLWGETIAPSDTAKDTDDYLDNYMLDYFKDRLTELRTLPNGKVCFLDINGDTWARDTILDWYEEEQSALKRG